MPTEPAAAEEAQEPEPFKTCSRCKKSKPLSNFCLKGSNIPGTSRTCLQCRQWHRASMATRRAEPPTPRVPANPNLPETQEMVGDQPLMLERPIPVDTPQGDPGMQFTEAQKRALLLYFAS